MGAKLPFDKVKTTAGSVAKWPLISMDAPLVQASTSEHLTAFFEWHFKTDIQRYAIGMDTNTKNWLYEELGVWMSYTIANCWSWYGGSIDTPFDERYIHREGTLVLEAALDVLDELALTERTQNTHRFLVKAENLRPAIRCQLPQGPSFKRLFSRVLWLDEHYPLFGERDGVLHLRREGLHLRKALIDLGYIFALETGDQAKLAWTVGMEPIFREAEYLADSVPPLTEQAAYAMEKLGDSVVSAIKGFKHSGDTDIAIRRFRLEASTEFSIAKYAVEQLI